MVEENLFEAIKNSTNILLISHQWPDADTLGAHAAFRFFLSGKNKQVTSFCIDPVPLSLRFSQIFNDFNNDKEKIRVSDYDLIIVFDCGSFEKTGLKNLLQQRAKTTTLVNIDHHHDNDRFGDINLVDLEASSTSEIIYNFFKKIKLKLTKEITHCLLTGIMFDTNFFTNAATTINSIKLSSDLLSKGASLHQVTKILWRNKSLKLLKLWGIIFSRLNLNEIYDIATSVVTLKDLEDCDVSELNHSEISNFLRSLSQPKMVLLMVEQKDGTIRCSMRTTKEEVDVSRLAEKLGGGGHKKAAAASIRGKIQMNTDGTWEII